MKRIFTLITIIVLIFTLSACKSKNITVNCPNCNEVIPKDATICEYCDTVTSDFETTHNDTSSDNATYIESTENAVQEPLSEDTFEDSDSNSLSSENQNSANSQPSSKPIDSSKICIVVGCNKERFSSSYCVDHKCANSACTSERFTFDGYSPYCSAHMCNKDGCDKLSVTGQLGGYCVDHTCKEPSCEFMKNNSGNLNYCSTHGCVATGCGNAKSGYKSYCDEHACIENYCVHQKEPGSNYCISHECNYPDCHNPQDGYGTFCDLHDD